MAKVNNARLLSAAGSDNATLVKARKGKVLKISGYNARGSAVYLKLYDKATAPTVGTDTPFATIYLAASSAFNHEWENGLDFTLGLGYGTTTAGADNSTAAVTAADILAMNIAYH